MDVTRTPRIGIASYAEIKDRTLRIARGELKPRPSDPKIWAPSLESREKIPSVAKREQPPIGRLT
jgi:predicted transcriptional regulator